jgi:hypothetical protein
MNFSVRMVFFHGFYIRRHVEFNQGNTKYLRMRFFVEGPFKKGTVHLEKKQVSLYLRLTVVGYFFKRLLL